jgi:hypothetical protein
MNQNSKIPTLIKAQSLTYRDNIMLGVKEREKANHKLRCEIDREIFR